MKRVMNTRYAPYLVLALLFGGLVVDLNTDQELVVSIIFNIPIAMAGVLLSKNLTWWTIGGAFAANLAAGYDNAQIFGGFDDITIFNRGLAALSFLLVGAMSLLFEQTSEEVEELADAEQHGEQERALRHFLTGLSGPLEPSELLMQAADGLRDLLGADALVITGLDGERFAEPRWASPAYTGLATTGKLASWAVDALPLTVKPVITVRSDDGIMSVGRWRCNGHEDLIVLAARPDRGRSSEMLGEALAGLEPLRERAEVLYQLRQDMAHQDFPT